MVAILRTYFRPLMIYGFDRNDGIFLPDTRVSNTTYIECKDKLNIEDNVFIGHFTYIDASRGVTIKEGCQISFFVNIASHSSHIAIRLYGKKYQTAKDPIGYLVGPVFIDRYSFVGSHCLIMPNTHIGKGSLVLPYSYVKGTFPDFAIIGGSPARVVGDTRVLDAEYLENHPELQALYDEWAK